MNAIHIARSLAGYAGSTWLLSLISLANWVLFAGETKWVPAGNGPIPWHSAGISADGTRMIASADDGTVWLSFDSGRSWTNRFTILNSDTSFSQGASAVSADGSRFLAAPGGGASLFLSRNDGATWQDTGLVSSERTGWRALACSSNGLVLAAASSGVNIWGPPVNSGAIYLSRDGGNSWNKAATETNFWTGLACSADGRRIFASVGGIVRLMDHGSWTGWVLDPGPIMVSEDNGATWRSTGAPDRYWRSVTCSADGSRLFAAVNHFHDYRSRGTPAEIYASDDGGVTWRPTAAPLRSWNSVACSADGLALVAACEVDELRSHGAVYASTDGGITWLSAPLPTGDPITFGRVGVADLTNTWPHAAISADGSRLMACWNGHDVWLGSRTPVSWSLSSAPPGDWAAVACSADGLRIAAAAQILAGTEEEAAIFLSADGGAAWVRSTAPNAPWTSIASSSDGRWLAASAGFDEGIYASSDFGKTWRKTSAPNADWRSIAMSADGSRLLAGCFYSGTSEEAQPGALNLSSDGGMTWTKSSAPNLPWQCVASSSDGARLVAGSGQSSEEPIGFIYLSADAGATWRRADAPGEFWTSLACSADGQSIIAGSTRAVFISSDQGASWRQAVLPEDGSWNVACSADGITLFAAGGPSEFYFRSTNSGASWVQETVRSSGGWGLAMACSADGVRAVVGERGFAFWGERIFEHIYVRGLLPPAFGEQPESQVAAPGSSVTFAVSVSGAEGTYRWQKDGKDLADAPERISGSAAAQLIIHGLSPADAGLYSVIVSNSLGAVQSSPASLALTRWKLAENTSSSRPWTAMASSESGATLFATDGAGIIRRSSDAGRSWSICLNIRGRDGFRDIATDASGTRVFAITWSVGIYVSADCGETWTVHNLPLPEGAFFWRVASSKDGLRVMVTSSGESAPMRGTVSGPVYLSQDGGLTWTASSMGEYTWRAAAISADASTRVVGANYWDLRISRDGGQTWTAAGLGNDNWSALAVSENGSVIYAGSDPVYQNLSGLVRTGVGRIMKSSDGGRSWTTTSAPDCSWEQMVCSADGSQVLAIGRDWPARRSNAHYSRDGGHRWGSAHLPDGVSAIAMSANGGRLAAAIHPGRIFLSPDAPNLQAAFPMGMKSLHLSWLSASPIPCILQSTTNLEDPDWRDYPIPNPSANLLSVPVDSPRQFFRLLAIP